ncbi:MAG: RNA polymerase sigma factor [Rubricoccaceae bacterium]
MSLPDAPPAADWQRALAGDRDAFERALAPYQKTLLEHARAQVARHEADGALGPRDLTPEELFGEMLLRAWQNRTRFAPERMRFVAWLTGLQHRALMRFLREENRHASRRAFSLTDEVPSGETEDAAEDTWYEFRQPFDVTTYGELIPSTAPDDLALSDLPDDERAARLRDALDETQRSVLLLHDEFDLSLAEVAQILDASLKDTAEAVNAARASLREHLGSVALPDDDEPATDSYTGEPV